MLPANLPPGRQFTSTWVLWYIVSICRRCSGTGGATYFYDMEHEKL
ncbi:Uncharacterised protein [Anaerotruncus sp. 2789STDY5834896]|uniref:Uncharacterized protein n=1 Tax=uncultured Anaerotruncus sp. TaxID=905011 RepID=A0A1C6GFU5_9FIRM|nr:Uncharacterised protein [uncultured Anaerotruncus sp.]